MVEANAQYDTKVQHRGLGGESGGANYKMLVQPNREEGE